jgi:hypothetical protein
MLEVLSKSEALSLNTYDCCIPSSWQNISKAGTIDSEVWSFNSWKLTALVTAHTMTSIHSNAFYLDLYEKYSLDPFWAKLLCHFYFGPLPTCTRWRFGRIDDQCSLSLHIETVWLLVLSCCPVVNLLELATTCWQRTCTWNRCSLRGYTTWLVWQSKTFDWLAA